MSRAASVGEKGAALIVGLIMLVLITLMLITALNLGTTNFRAVANMQFRSEAVAAANMAIEQVISTPFTAAPAAESINVDIDNDADTDYDVAVAVPECIYAAQAFGADPSSLSLPVSMSASSTWNTVWDVDATATDDDNRGRDRARARGRPGAAHRGRKGRGVPVTQRILQEQFHEKQASGRRAGRERLLVRRRQPRGPRTSTSSSSRPARPPASRTC